MANYHGDIPLNADKMLFAEDLIYWYLRSRWPTLCSHTLKRTDVSNNSVDNYRAFIYNAFNCCVTTAIDFIDESIEPAVWADFVSMQNADRLNAEAFAEYANGYHDHYFSDGFEATRFLEYCTRLANMAGYFRVRARENVLPLAVDLIVKAFPEGDMFAGGWDILKRAAGMYAKLNSDILKELTPSDSSDSSSNDSSDHSYVYESEDSSAVTSDADPSDTDPSDADLSG